MAERSPLTTQLLLPGGPLGSATGGSSPVSGISAGHVEFSRDGKWVTYVTYPENNLWRSRPDGSEALQLTYSPLLVVQPHWSPDGSQIAFTGIEPDKPWRIYTVPAAGGPVQPMLVEDRSQLDPVWSPDGKSIIFGRIVSREQKFNLQLIDLTTRKVSDLPGSDGLWVPQWSADGKYLLAEDREGRDLKIFDFKSQKWSTLLSTKFLADFHFSHDNKFVYYDDFEKDAIQRVSISGRKFETVVSVKDFQRPRLPYWSFWMGLDPSDSILLMHDTGNQEIYALDLQQ